MTITRTGGSLHKRAGQWTGIAAVLLLAFAVRLAVVLWLSDTHPYSDYYYYHQAGRLSAEDWSFWFDSERVLKLAKLSWWPPGYPMFLGAVYEVFGANHRAVAFVHAVLGTLVCGLVYLTTRRILNARSALIATALIALNPHYVFTTNLVASENLFVVWLMLGLWLSLRPWARKRDAAWAGAALALATLTRGVAALLPIVILLWKRSVAHLESHSWRPQAAVMFATVALVILPWSVRNWLVVGEPVLVSHGAGLNFYYGHSAFEPTFRDVSQTPMSGLQSAGEVDRHAWRLGLRHLLRDPLGEFGRTVFKVRELFASPGYALQANNAVRRPDGWRYDPAVAALAEEARERQRGRARYLRTVFSPLAAAHTRLLWIGALAALLFWRRFTPGMRLMTWLVVYWVGAHILFWAQPRFRYPMEIPMAILTTFAMTSIAAALRRRTRRTATQTLSAPEFRTK